MIPVESINIATSILADLHRAMSDATTPVTVSGSTSPDVSGNYTAIPVEINDYQILSDGTFFIWNDGEGHWIICENYTTTGNSPFWQRNDTSILGDYAPATFMGASGTATVATGETIFQEVIITCEEDRAFQKYYTHAPIALLRYGRTEEHYIADNKLGIVVSLTISLVVSSHEDSTGSSDLTRVIAQTQNIISAAIPTDACAFVDKRGSLHRLIEWGEPEFDTKRKQPWARCSMPLQVAAIVNDHLSH